MARVVILALVLLACVPSVSALSAGDALTSFASIAGLGDDGGCVHYEDESEEGPVKVGQEEPGVFVGIPGTATETSTDGESKGLVSLEGPFSGVGVFIRNRDCELPALDDPGAVTALVA